jgi:predicted lipoprotein with Yx(FWY)xxD motif
MHILRAAGPLLGLTLLLAACSATGSGTAAPAATAPTPAPSVAPRPPPAVTVNLADTALGSILADGEGRILYGSRPTAAAPRPAPATARPVGRRSCPTRRRRSGPASTPRTSPRSPATTVDAGRLLRHPLYYFAGDTAAGQTNGQSVGGKWFVVDGEGTRRHGGVARRQRARLGGRRWPHGRSPIPTSAASSPTARAGSVRVHRRQRRQVRRSGDCLANWPALLSDAGATPGEGLDAEDFGTIARDDGGTQVTFYGMPLYDFAGDTAAGQTNGQGVGGKWFVVDAEGKMIQ